jgi:hypothetical protein
MSQVYTISQEATTKIEKWATKFNTKFDDVAAIYMKNLVSVNGDEKKALVYSKIALEEEFGSLLSNAPFYWGYVLEDNGVTDIFELMRQKSINMAQSDDPTIRAEAETNGYVDINGVPLDYRKTVFGEPNVGFGNPLTGHSYQRAILAIISADEAFSKPSLVELTAEGEFAKNLDKVPNGTFYKFRVNVNPKYPNRARLSAGTKFSPVTSTITLAEIANKLNTCAFTDLDIEYGNNFAGKKRTSYLTALRGYVAAMSLTPMKGSRLFVMIDTDDGQVKCYIREQVPITFKKADDVIAFARLYMGKDGKIGAQVRAYMVVG